MTAKGSFSVEGKAHRMLARLHSGPARLNDLAELIRTENQNAKAARGRTLQFLAALRAEALIITLDGTHYLTPEGADALTGLDYGQPYNRDARPQAVRYFEGARA